MKAGDLYPWTLHKAGKLTKVVHDDAQKAAALADGWCVAPPDQQPTAVEPEPEPVAPPKRRK